MAMKTIKVAEATELQLDWLVAKCEGHNVAILSVQEQRERWLNNVPPEKMEREAKEYETYIAPLAKPEIRIACEDGYKRTPHHSEAMMLFGDGVPRFQYSTNWAQGGPIIDRLDGFELKVWLESHPDSRCEAHLHNYEGDWIAFGPTALIAAMRCYVASKLGGVVEVPEELV